MEEPNAYYFGSMGSAKGCWSLFLGLLALILIYTTNTENKKQCQTKKKGISVYAFGSTRFHNRGRKQTSNSIHDHSALKTWGQVSEMLACSLGTGLFKPSLRVQQLWVFLSLLIKKNLALLCKREASPSCPCVNNIQEDWVQCRGLPQPPWVTDLWVHIVFQCLLWTWSYRRVSAAPGPAMEVQTMGIRPYTPYH